MQAQSVMSRDVITVAPNATIEQVAQLMVKARISGIPVIDERGQLVGIVTEGDLLRRMEIGTAGQSASWRDLFTSSRHLAAGYLKSHSRAVHEVMTAPVVSVTEDTELAEVADLLERHRIKRLPVSRDGKLVGMVSRVDLVGALLTASEKAAPPIGDLMIRDHLIAELRRQSWTELAPANILVTDGVVQLWGCVASREEQAAIRVAAENIPGVRGVENHLTVPKILV